jgi:hypothetical protein
MPDERAIKPSFRQICYVPFTKAGTADPPKKSRLETTMKSAKLVTGALATAALVGLLSASPAEAQHRRRGPSGAAVAAGIVGGLAVGALIASSRPAYASGPVYVADPYYAPHPYPAYRPYCYRSWQPVYDGWGRYVGERRVKVCE